MEISFGEYLSGFNNSIDLFLSSRANEELLKEAIRTIKNTKSTDSTIFMIGNGGSSAIAEHMAIDFTKNAGLRAMAISGSPTLTTFSNDYGYERVFEKAIESFAREGDLLIAISSSGASRNILNGCEASRRKNMGIITFSGFDPDNPLRQMGDINLWVDSKAFGYVELIHNLLIHYINDTIVGAVEYLIR